MGTVTRPGIRGTTSAVMAMLAAVALLSGCGQVDPTARLAQAAEATTADETARMTVTSELSGAGLGGGFHTSTEGEIDFAAERMRLVTSFGEGPFDFDIEMITEGSGVSYMRLPEEAGGGWVRTDPSDFGLDPSGADSWGQTADPGSMLRWLEDLATEVEEVGEEQVRGQSATRYRMTLDYVGALEGTDDEQTREALGRSLAAMGLAEIPADAWVDERDRVVRLTQEIDLGAADPAAMRELLSEQFDGFDDLDVPNDADAGSLGIEGTQKVTVEFHDFGADLGIELPSDDEVIDLDDLDGLLGPTDF